ncbi:MAG: putative nucleotidyltransferase substrate binding domain-containing protein, partial [Vicinamibacteria bacterium]
SLDAACGWAVRSLAAKIGRPRVRYGDLRGDTDADLTAIAMGKLGGRELNYSSDIDVVFLYHSDETAGETPVAPHVFFSRAVELVSRVLAERTDQGFVFRIDLRLRPEGRSGPPANSLEAAERYYESWGTLFERQAMLKARPVAGEIRLGRDFEQMIAPFRYPQSLDIKSFEEIRRTKEKIEEERSSELALGEDVKRGRGGIREIEFFVQALQLLMAGRRPALRRTNTLETLAALAGESVIDREAADTLDRAYRFLRTLEHRLQVVEERQTHALPRRPEEQRALARRMGYSDGSREEARENLLHDFERTRETVRSIFEGLFRGASRFA